MEARFILGTFVTLKILQYIAELYLGAKNRQYYLQPDHQLEAMKVLGISKEDMEKSLSYSTDKYFFGRIAGRFKIFMTLAFIICGGLGWVETFAIKIAGADHKILVGLVFFGILALLSMLMSLPFDYYSVFRIEERHGFNRQKPKTFFLDRLKGILIGFTLGGALLGLILWIMQRLGDYWWAYAAGAVCIFSLLTAWLYPTVLAPLFNKFSPVPEGELKERIFKLADQIGFNCSGLSIMNASVRSSHGNAYFTGVFGKKKIVLFDTLVDSLIPDQVVAVLAHELGHFKLNHVRNSLIRGFAMTFGIFFLLSLCLPLGSFYTAFHLQGVSDYGALLVFSMWFSLSDFLLQPFENYLSRRNEFAADAFAKKHMGGSKELAAALLKLREKSHSMPISHPWFSAVYYSHPPMIERLKAMEA